MTVDCWWNNDVDGGRNGDGKYSALSALTSADCMITFPKVEAKTKRVPLQMKGRKWSISHVERTRAKSQYENLPRGNRLKG